MTFESAQAYLAEASVGISSDEQKEEQYARF